MVEPPKYVEDNVTMRQLCFNPVFLAEVFFAVLMTVTAFTATVAQLWPPFCVYNHWLSFINLGVISSCIFIEIASILTWIIFDNNNWIYYLIVYFTHGSVIVLAGTVFFTDYGRNCDNEGSWPCLEKYMDASNSTNVTCNISVAEACVEGSFVVSGCGYLGLGVVILFLREKFA